MRHTLILQCLLLGIASGFLSELGALVRKRRQTGADIINFTPECTIEISKMSESCLQNTLSFVDTFKVMEKQAVSMWGQECATNMYSCIASPDAETGKVLEFFKVLLPKLKKLCQDGCMIPIINIVHACLRPEALTEIGLSRTQMEDIFDLACIQEPRQANGEEGEYCILKAMTTALYLYEANKISYCNLDDIDVSKCGTATDQCTCNTNCSTLVKQGTSLMGCCMGTLVEIEKELNVSHPNSPDMMAPGNALLKLCGATAEQACKSSKDQLKDQEMQYEHCKSALRANAKSECIELEDNAHAAYIAEMQNINKDCAQQKNLGLCTDPMASIGITDEFVVVMTNLNRHCDECEAELMGIRDNCTVFLPHEARMAFGMMCMHNSDLNQCGTEVIKYEAERLRKDLNSNPCFKGFMSPFANQCSEECITEVGLMNEAKVLSCFDALVRYSHLAVPEWQLWHRSCIVDRDVKINNYINATFILGVPEKDDGQTAKVSESRGSLIMYTILGTVAVVVLIVVITGGVVMLYKRQSILDMFSYNRFRGGDPGLISDVHMEDTFDHDDEDNFNTF